MKKTGDKSDTIKAVQMNWLGEKRSAATYRQLAEDEADEKRKQILLRMAEAEERHADRWARKLLELGAPPPRMPSGLNLRFRKWLNRRLGTELTIRRMEAAEEQFTIRYSDQHEQAFRDDPESQQILKEFAAEERAHAKALQAMTGPPGPQSKLDRILNRERWHGRGGGWIADAIYGVNDGLGAVFGIVSGVAGALSDPHQNPEQVRHFILISGMAGMIASALSMGAGAYLAVKSEHEVHEAEIHRERQEIEDNPEEEAEELALFYQLQGFEAEESRRMADKVAEDPQKMLRALSQHELGLSEEHFRHPWVSAFSAMISTAVGAFIPIIPFFFMRGLPALLTACVVSLVAHFAVGAAKSIITIRSWWASGFEMTIVGIIEAAVTYGLGLMFGSMA